MKTTNYLAENLYILRRYHGYTQEYVSTRLHIKRQTYANYENGYHEPSIHMLLSLATFYNIRLDILICYPILDALNKIDMSD